jgi:hypothetical protein
MSAVTILKMYVIINTELQSFFNDGDIETMFSCNLSFYHTC